MIHNYGKMEWIILFWLIWISGGADLGFSTLLSRLFLTTSTLPSRYFFLGSGIWILLSPRAFSRFIGWAISAEFGYFWTPMNSWEPAYFCHRSGSATQRWVFSWPPIFCWGIWWWWWVALEDPYSISAPSSSTQTHFSHILIKQGLLELRYEERIVLTLDFDLDFANIGLNSLNRAKHTKV